MDTINDQNPINTASEYEAPCWSVLSFEKCEKSNLSYEAAQRFIEEMAPEKLSGVCIVTDKAASRILQSNGRFQIQDERRAEDGAKQFNETF